MNSPVPRPAASDRLWLCYDDLHQPGRGYRFPCNAQGQVDLDALSETARAHYFYARAMVGHGLSTPHLRPGPELQ